MCISKCIDFDPFYLINFSQIRFVSRNIKHYSSDKLKVARSFPWKQQFSKLKFKLFGCFASACENYVHEKRSYSQKASPITSL